MGALVRSLLKNERHEESPPPIATQVAQTRKALSSSTEIWSHAVFDAGNRADRDPGYARKVEKRLFYTLEHFSIRWTY